MTDQRQLQLFHGPPHRRKGGRARGGGFGLLWLGSGHEGAYLSGSWGVRPHSSPVIVPIHIFHRVYKIGAFPLHVSRLPPVLYLVAAPDCQLQHKFALMIMIQFITAVSGLIQGKVHAPRIIKVLSKLQNTASQVYGPPIASCTEAALLRPRPLSPSPCHPAESTLPELPFPRCDHSCVHGNSTTS